MCIVALHKKELSLPKCANGAVAETSWPTPLIVTSSPLSGGEIIMANEFKRKSGRREILSLV